MIHIKRGRNTHQNQSLELFYKKIFLNKKFRKIHRKTTMLKFLFNNVAELQTSNFVKKKLQRKFFPVIIVQFLGKHIWKNICKRLLLTHTTFWNSGSTEVEKKKQSILKNYPKNEYLIKE